MVLGMHRSGTSALAGTFSQLGLSLGDELMPATADANPKGYFEHMGVVQVHERLLAAFGMDWADPRPLPESWLRHPATRQARAELEALLQPLLAGGDTVVIKDPRTCRFVPLWRELLAGLGVQAHFAFIARHPVEVAASLRRRDGMSEYRAGLLTLAHQMEAEQASRGASRVFLTYEALIADWQAQVARCRAVFGADVLPEPAANAAAVDGFLDAQLRNHRASEVFALEPDVVEAYRCFDAAASTGEQQLAATMDAIRARFEAGRRGYAAAMEATLSALELDHGRHVPAWSRGLALASAWNAPPSPLQPLPVPKVYFRGAGQGYAEERSSDGTLALQADGSYLLAVEVAVGLPLQRLRFDPDSQAGVYQLLGLAVDGRAVEDVAALATVIHQQRLPAEETGTVAWASADDDPWLELDLSALAASPAGSAPRRLEVRFQRVTAASQALQASQAQSRVLRADVGALAEQMASQASQAQASQDAQLAALLAQVGALSVMVGELKQRSDRPLLHRLGRKLQLRALRKAQRGAGWPLPLQPLANASATGDGYWQASNCDPQFNACLQEAFGGSPPAGWYLLDLQARARQGQLDNPCLYLDYGNGMAHAEQVGLMPYMGARSQTVLYLRAGLCAMRLDPTDEDACFQLQASLRPLGRWAALRCMLQQTRQLQYPTLSRAGLVRRLLGRALRLGPGGLRAQIVADYRALPSPQAGDYAKWLRRAEPVVSAEQAAARLAVLPRRPLLSVVMPVYQAPERWLRKALDSVLAQHYPDWELCVSDDASPSPHVRAVLQEYQQRDPRIKVVFRAQNGHISESSNSALEVASGDYMVLLDHDDELHPEALLLVAETLGRHPDAQLLYSDEDKIDEDGRRFDAYFKADWNYDLFLGQNCISHLGIYALPLVREIGGFRKGLEGSQDWDLALRCIERIRPEQIVHIPRVLYHWRAIQGSTALAAGEKNYAVVAGRRAVAEHLQRTGQDGEVSILPASMMRVQRALPAPAPKVSLVIPTRDRVDLLRVCVDSILERSSYPDYEILIVDNGSVEPQTLAYFEQVGARDNVRVLPYPGEFNYSAINNFAVAQARGQVIGLVNNDIEVISADWMEEMVSHAMRPDVGAVGAMLYYPDDTIQHAGVLVGLCGVAGHIGSCQPRGSAGYFGRMLLAQQLTAVTAACLLVRKSVYDEVGGLDEQLRVAFNDVDLCLRIDAKGYRNLWTPFAELYHHESASRGLEDNPVKQARFASEVEFMCKRWDARLQRDRAYNPNLSLSRPFALEP